MKFDTLISSILLEQSLITPEQLANKFVNEILSKYIYKKVRKGHLSWQ